MTTRLKITALSLGLAVVFAGATGASAHSRFESHRDHRGYAEARFERHHHRFAERRHERFARAERRG